MEEDKVLQVRKLRAGYELNQKFMEVVSDVSVELVADEIFGLAGESGCGKSTLLKVIYGAMDPPLKRKSGHIRLKTADGVIDLDELRPEELKRKVWWRYITWIPQGAMNVLNPTMKIRDHFIEMFELYSNLTKKEAYGATISYLQSIGLSKEVINAYPSQLSGGMRQRVVISLALLFNPSIVLADEPTSALDVVTQKILLEQLMKLQKERHFTLLLVSHDMNVHGVFTDRIGIMYAGKLVEIGPTDRIFAEPLHPYTRALIDSLPRIDDRSAKKGLPGSPPDLINPPLGCRFHPRCPYRMDVCTKEEPPMLEVGSKRHVTCWLYVER